MLVCFDATVLCGALRRPTGPNFRLLELAAEDIVVEGFTTEVVGMEFVRNALEGLGGVQYEIAVVEEFSMCSARFSTRSASPPRRSAGP